MVFGIVVRVASEEAVVSCDENLLSSLGEEMVVPLVRERGPTFVIIS